MRYDLSSLSLVALVFTGCQSSINHEDSGPRTNPIEVAPALPSVAVSPVVLPEAETLSYVGMLRQWEGGEVKQAIPAPPISARIETVGQRRRISIDGGPQVRGEVMASAAGRIDAGEAKFPSGIDLIEQLPPAETELKLDAGWVSEPPAEAYVRANAAADKMTMTDAVHSTPRAIWSVDGHTVVRLDTVARHRISWVDEDTQQIRSVELGLSYAGVTDLVQTAGGGWRVLQFTRLIPAKEVAANTTADQLRAQDHVEFTACANTSTRVDLRSLRRRGSTEVPELALCNL
jgi:hypothetical protein